MMEVLFRNENYSGSGIRDAKEVLSYEMFDLDNSDIPITLAKTIFNNYPIAKNYCEKVAKIIESGIENNPDDRLVIDKSTSLVWAGNIIDFIRIVTGKSIKYVLWLADMDIVMNGIYGISGGHLQEYDTIDAYQVGPILLSDLGGAGKLYGYEELPKPFAAVTVSNGQNVIDNEGSVFECMH